MKKFQWKFKTSDDEEVTGEADTYDEAEKAMEAAGYFEGELFSEIIELSDEVLVEAARNTAKPLKVKSTLQNLAEANDVMFKQMDGMKNTIADLEIRLAGALFEGRRVLNAGRAADEKLIGVRELVLAWNSEQHARLGAAHREHAFVEMLREYVTNPALAKDGEYDEEKQDRESEERRQRQNGIEAA